MWKKNEIHYFVVDCFIIIWQCLQNMLRMFTFGGNCTVNKCLYTNTHVLCEFKCAMYQGCRSRGKTVPPLQARGRRFLPYKPGEDGSSLTSRGKTVPPLQAGGRRFLPYTLWKWELLPWQLSQQSTKRYKVFFRLFYSSFLLVTFWKLARPPLSRSTSKTCPHPSLLGLPIHLICTLLWNKEEAFVRFDCIQWKGTILKYDYARIHNALTYLSSHLMNIIYSTMFMVAKGYKTCSN